MTFLLSCHSWSSPCPWLSLPWIFFRHTIMWPDNRGSPKETMDLEKCWGLSWGVLGRFCRSEQTRKATHVWCHVFDLLCYSIVRGLKNWTQDAEEDQSKHLVIRFALLTPQSIRVCLFLTVFKEQAFFHSQRPTPSPSFQISDVRIDLSWERWRKFWATSYKRRATNNTSKKVSHSSLHKRLWSW